MRLFHILILILFSSILSFGQIRFVRELKPQQFNMLADLKMNTAWIKPTASEKEVFSFAIKSHTSIQLEFRTKTRDKKISIWQTLAINAHRQKDDKNWVSELYFLPNNTNGIQFRHKPKDKLLESVEINFIDIAPGYAMDKKVKSDSTTCECEQPPYFNREAWCPNNECPEISNPVLTDVTHLIVHHAASTNSSSNWAGVVRSIWEFHVNVNGWADIGYNWLIDPEGEVYQGRGDNVRGAHFCATNTGTTGLCMLGNFQLEAPKDEAVDKLVQILSWKACDVNIIPTESSFHNSSGLILNNISGHRQGCNTVCPGDLFFPQFTEIRIAVENYNADSCETTISQIENVENELAIEIFPNPAFNNISISYDKEFTYSIFDANGNQIKIENNQAQKYYDVDLAQYSEGVYFLYFKLRDQYCVKKFTVLRAN